MFSTPAVADGLLFVGSCSGRFMAMNPRTGKVAWDYNIHTDGEQTSFHGNLLSAGNLILIASDNTFNHKGIGHIYAFDRASGDVVWKYRDECGVSTDVVRAGRHIFAVTLADELVCIDLRTGKRQWGFKSGADTSDLRQPASPVTHGDRVFFGGLNGTVCALQAATGELAWQRELGERVSLPPVIWHEKLIVGTADSHLFSLDLKTGKTLKSLKLSDAPGSPPVCTDGLMYFRLGADQVAAVAPALESVRWTRAFPDRITVSRPHLINDSLLIGTSKGDVVALDAATGGVQWQHRFDDETIRAIGHWKDMIFVGTQRGMLYACSAVRSEHRPSQPAADDDSEREQKP